MDAERELASAPHPADVTPIGERAEPVQAAVAEPRDEPSDAQPAEAASDAGGAAADRQVAAHDADAGTHDEQQGSDADSEPPTHAHEDDLEGSFFSQPPSEPLVLELAYDDETTTGRAAAARAVAATAGFEARRARLRRLAAILVGAMGLVAGGALARRAMAPSRAAAVTTNAEVAAPAPAPPPPAIAAAPAGEATSVPVADEPPQLEASQPADEVDPPARAATAAPSATAAPAAAPPASAVARDPARAKALLKELVSLLHRSKNEEAIPVARAAIGADPTDAMGYLYLGAAMQELRRPDEERAAYDECVRTAKHNGVDQCRALGGRKRR